MYLTIIYNNIKVEVDKRMSYPHCDKWIDKSLP